MLSGVNIINKKFFSISIDVEIDQSRNWHVSEKESFKGVLQGLPHILTPIFEQIGARPTYLLSPEVIDNRECVDTLKNLPNCELGTHLHGDVIDPKRTITRLSGQRLKEMQSSYSYDLEYSKIEKLTSLFKENFGYNPKSFRAGRFGAGNNTINCLEKLGYLVDSSVTSGIDWIYPEGRANFSKAPDQPYFPDRTNIIRAGNSTILEVPVTVYSNNLTRFLYLFEKRAHVFRPFVVPIRRASGFHWLRPSFESSKQMISVCRKMTNRYKGDLIALNMMFHNVEVIPGASPYTLSEDDVKTFLKNIELVLEYVNIQGFQFCKLSELPLFYK